MEPVLYITPTGLGTPDATALFVLNVIVEDEEGFLLDALLTITWSDGHAPLVIGPTADVKIPLEAAWSPFVLSVQKPGYATVHQPFVVSLSETMQYEFTVTLQEVGDVAQSF